MGMLEEIIKAKTRHHRGYDGDHLHHHDDHYDYRDHDHHSRKHEQLRRMIEALPHKRLILGIVLFVLFLLIGIAIIALVLLFPLLSAAVDYISQNGIQGAVEAILQFAHRLWQGNK